MNSSQKKINRVLLVVMDSVGVGELPDAGRFGDAGANTLANCAREFAAKTGQSLALKNLGDLGIGNLTSIPGTPPCTSSQKTGAFGKALEKSQGKDTTSGHWEIAGYPVLHAFATYPGGFSREVVDRWIAENHLPGILGNKAASGTEIIEELGPEHLRSGKPILYTSADSVWQVAAHEEVFGLERLYKICKSARKICDELNVSRVIARPFIGDPTKGVKFSRTYNRKDLSQLPGKPTILNALEEQGARVIGIGKIANIYAASGVTENFDTQGNRSGIETIIRQLDETSRQPSLLEKGLLIFCNLIDFDMLYGHRRDAVGYGKALEEFDRALPGIMSRLGPHDLLILTADHGNDPCFKGTDHTREYIPILAYSPAQKTHGLVDLGIRESFSDIGATITQALLGREMSGKSFLSKLGIL